MVTRTVETIEFWGNDLALDFANTVEGDPPRIDHLRTYADLVTWARRAGALPEGSGPRRGDLARARELRDAISAVFSAHAAGRQPSRAPMRTLTAAYAEAVQNGVLAAGAEGESAGGLSWVWTGRHPDRPLWPISVAAVDLLRSDRLGRLKRCANCNWLFIDRSRNGSRRWCSMDECGVHTKMRRYRAARRG